MPNTSNRPARDRAWRRAQRVRLVKQRSERYIFNAKGDARQRGRLAKTNIPNVENISKEKNWNHLYTRKVKIKRADQLKMIWPRPDAKMRKLMEGDA